MWKFCNGNSHVNCTKNSYRDTACLTQRKTVVGRKGDERGKKIIALELYYALWHSLGYQIITELCPYNRRSEHVTLLLCTRESKLF